MAQSITRPGALTARARAARMSLEAYARQHAKDPGVVGYDSRLYLTALEKSTLPAKKTRRDATSAEGTALSKVGNNTGLPFGPGVTARKGPAGI